MELLVLDIYLLFHVNFFYNLFLGHKECCTHVMLLPQCYKEVANKVACETVDSCLLLHLQYYKGTTTLAHALPCELFYIFLPLDLIPPTLSRVKEDGHALILIVLYWPAMCRLTEIYCFLLLHQRSSSHGPYVLFMQCTHIWIRQGVSGGTISYLSPGQTLISINLLQSTDW